MAQPGGGEAGLPWDFEALEMQCSRLQTSVQRPPHDCWMIITNVMIVGLIQVPSVVLIINANVK